jgi:hypothetical protein
LHIEKGTEAKRKAKRQKEKAQGTRYKAQGNTKANNEDLAGPFNDARGPARS